MTETNGNASTATSRPDAHTFSPDLPVRPALADRQCQPGNEAAKPGSQPGNAQRSKEQGKLPRAGTFSNSRLSRSNSSKAGLPRGRSFQGTHPLSPETQAKNNGYRQRKAAKAVAEKRRAARAEKGTKDHKDLDWKETSGNVINITVDDKGIMIDGGRGLQGTPIQGTPGMGSRSNSRSKMTRSSSKQRYLKRSDEKENAALGSADASEADIDDYFRRKRADHSKRKKDNPESVGSWDGSMPRRQSTRSFIERTPRSKPRSDTSKSLGQGDESQSGDANKRKLEKQRRQRGTDVAQGSANGTTTDKKISSITASKPNVAANSSVTVTGNCLTKPQALSNSSSTASVSEPGMKDGTPEQKDRQCECALLENVGVKGNNAKAFMDASAVSMASVAQSASGIVGGIETSPSASQSMLPSSGKWCDNCSGVGLLIAALLTELEKSRPMPETGSELPTTSNGQKKGWKSMVTQTVLGDGKTKSSSEKSRMQQEISVLRATVEFLYKKVEFLEGGSSVDPAETL